MNKKISVVSLCCFMLLLISCGRQLGKFEKYSSEQVLKAMTLEEKTRLAVGTAKMYPMPPPAAPGTFVKESKPEGYDAANVTFLTKAKVYGAAGDSYAIPKLGVPSIVFADGPAGVRIDPVIQNDPKTYYATAFPIATLLASSWNRDVVEQVGRAMGNEVLEYGIDILLATGMNIHRNPLTGRNFEYYSEDPLLSGKIAASMVNGIQSNGVGTSLKHFVANNQETYRNGVNAIVSERALREIYFKGFEIALKESQPWTVMSSYNKLNGEYTSESSRLLTKLLREEWGFKGFVMTDWWAEHDPVAQMKAGNDMVMPGTEEQIQDIIKAVQKGDLDESILDRNVKNILNVVKKSPVQKGFVYSNKPDLKAHATVVRKAAIEGMVLLENKSNSLPIQKDVKKAALFGVSSYSIIAGGYGSGYVFCPHKIGLDIGLKEAGFMLDTKLRDSYTNYLTEHKKNNPTEHFWYIAPIPEMNVNKEEIERLSNESDIAIFTIGRNSGEGADRGLYKGDYYLTDLEIDLIKNISKSFKDKGKKTIVVLNIGGVIEMTDWKDIPDAILLAWQPGQEAGYSITDVLTGAENPSGKLTMTFPKRYTDVPSSSNFPSSDNNPSMVKYKEDVFVGYRYYNTNKIKPLYEFGYGQSYTQFGYSEITIDSNELKDEINVSVTIKNKGNVSGKEVVQLYVSAPSTKTSRPAEELKAFAKTQSLKPGESQILKFKLAVEDLAWFDEKQSAWVTDSGVYSIKIGASSEDIRLTKTIEKKETSKKHLK